MLMPIQVKFVALFYLYRYPWDSLDKRWDVFEDYNREVE